VGGVWLPDRERTRIEFRVRAFWGLASVTGRFDVYDGRLDLSSDPAVGLTIDAGSLQTGNRRRDRHLRSPDFFDVESHPHVRFVSGAVQRRSETLAVRGHLWVRGRSIPLEVSARMRSVGDELELEASTVAAHRELGMTWSPLGMIAPRSELRIKARLIRAASSESAPAAQSYTERPAPGAALAP
jgi:polyisoprenoid-binding protein YceI